MSGWQDYIGHDSWDPGTSSLTKIDPEALRPLAQNNPEISAAFQLRDAAKEHGLNPDLPSAHGFFPWLTHNAGLTSAENYEGLPAALALAYYYLLPPIQSLWTIERQVSGVLDAAYNFLTSGGKAAAGAESAIAAGEKVLIADGIAGVGGVTLAFETGWA